MQFKNLVNKSARGKPPVLYDILTVLQCGYQWLTTAKLYSPHQQHFALQNEHESHFVPKTALHLPKSCSYLKQNKTN